MNTNIMLFDLIKDHQWDKFIEYVKNNEDIDVNIRDSTDNYLINYAIIFNKIDAVSILIHRGSRLDITDNDGRSILYVPIKFGFNKILELLLHFNQTNIGISLIDIRDKNDNIPLHYAIYNKNIHAVKLLLEYNSDVNIVDSNGFNSLQLSILNKNIEAAKLILEKNININSRTNSGESALHIACNQQIYDLAELLISKGINVNIQDYEHEFSALDYCIINNNVNMTSLLLKNGADVNIQDFFGNTALHYSIKEENYEIVNILIKSKFSSGKINYNLYNIDSQLPIHVLLEKKIDRVSEFVPIFLENSDLNFQDIDNRSTLHYIAMNGIWKNYKDILSKKKLDIFIIDNIKKRPIDYISKDDIDEFLKLIEDSYIYILRNRNAEWNSDWENMCNKELFVNKLTKNETDDLKKFIDLNTVKENDDICRTIVKNKLLEIYKNKDSTCNYSSFPSKLQRKCLVINEGDKVDMCTFTGINIDILFGLIYLLKKYKFATSTIDEHFGDNKDLCNYYKSLGISSSSRCEFINFEIIWILQKIYLSSSFKKNFKKRIEDKTKRFIIIPLGIELEKGSHANYLIYDKTIKELERFEPYGSSAPYQFDYNPTLLDNILKYKFMELDSEIKYFPPSSYMPKIGFQYFDVLEGSSYISDPGGFCALWSIWYVDQRLTYSDINRKSLIKKLMKSIKTKNISFKKIIRNYSKDIVNIRDNVLNKLGLTINNWINDEYTQKQFDELTQEITQIILKIE